MAYFCGTNHHKTQTDMSENMNQRCGVLFDLDGVLLDSEGQYSIFWEGMEKEYPTGLCAVMPIAIPHVSTHCRDSFMALVTLQKPLLFEPMDGRGDKLPVEIVFVFGLVDHRDQVKVLQQLAKMFKDREALQRLKEAATDAEGLALVEAYLGDLAQTI